MAQRVSGEQRVTDTQARQGFLDRPVLVVLMVAIALVTIGFALLWMGFFS